jgi:hypothetical protein
MQRNRERVARNFVEKFGADNLRRLLNLLAEGDSGQQIADELDVSRERVRQWKNTFGTLVTIYQVHPDVQQVIDELLPPAPPATDQAPWGDIELEID